MLALARAQSDMLDNDLEVEREPLALVVLSDEMRHDIRETLDSFRRQNVALKVISGDNLETVSEIAREAGMNVQRAYTGDQIKRMSESELQRAAVEGEVFARIEPETKRQIIAALRARGEYVAMVGDGVNDVPALKEANLAIVMNDGGADQQGCGRPRAAEQRHVHAAAGLRRGAHHHADDLRDEQAVPDQECVQPAVLHLRRVHDASLPDQPDSGQLGDVRRDQHPRDADRVPRAAPGIHAEVAARRARLCGDGRRDRRGGALAALRGELFLQRGRLSAGTQRDHVLHRAVRHDRAVDVHGLNIFHPATS
ncbi:MAG: HAD family hydrolase, partial [Blastochloris sp.]|nr:HAD family hydrolase [Blastochloris sp.]